MNELMTNEQLNQFTGLHTKNAWGDPTSLFKARARVSALGESPLREEGLVAIEQALNAADKDMSHDARRQREAADKIVHRYQTGVNDLATTWGDLRTLVEPGWDVDADFDGPF